MLTSTTDYDYVNWEVPVLNDAESPRGLIMPTEDELSAGHALRNEDFCYLYESLYQLIYGGWPGTNYLLPYDITPSISGQYSLRRTLGYLSGDWVQKYDTYRSLKPLLTKKNSLVASSGWTYIGTNIRNIYTSITSYIPNTDIVNCSGLDIELEEKPIDDQLMVKMYDILKQVRIVNVPTSYCRIDQSSPSVPSLGLWHFTGTWHYQSFNTSGQLTSDNQRPVNNSTGYNTNTAGAPITPGFNYLEYLCGKNYHYGTKTIASRWYVENSSLTVKVPKYTTACWFYVSVACAGGNGVCVKMLQATVDQINCTATAGGFGSVDDVAELVDIVGDDHEMNFFFYLSGVFCLIDAKWHWW